MNTILIILLVLLLNIILGCITTYYMTKRVTLADLIFSSFCGVFVFLIEASVEIFDTIERKCSRIVLFKVDE